VTVTFTAADGGAGATGVDSVTYSATGAQSVSSTTTTGSTASVTIGAEGVTTVSRFATDRAGNAESPKTIALKLDKTAPSIACAPADALWRTLSGSVRKAKPALRQPDVSRQTTGFQVFGDLERG